MVEHKYYKLLKSHYKMVVLLREYERLYQMTRERNLSACVVFSPFTWSRLCV